MLTDQDPDTTEISSPNDSSITVTEDDAIGEDEGQDQESTELATRPPQGLEKPRDGKGRWAAKKAERAKNHQELIRLRGEHESTLAELARLQAERDNWQRQPAPVQQQPQNQQPRVDPVDRELNEINAALEAELALLERDVNRSPKRYNDLQDRKMEIRMARMIAQSVRPQQAQQQGGVAPEYAARYEMLTSEFPWIADPSPQYNGVRQQIKSYIRHLKEGMGRPDTIDTDREAVTHIAAQNGINVRRPQARGAGAFATPASRGAPTERNGQRAVKIPSQLAAGSGLSVQQLAQAALSDDE